jgi:site-specific DNA-methyltransferase (adenine-specific)
MDKFIDQIHIGDCINILPQLPDDSIHCVVSDIPYGINLDDWDVLHENTNSALLGQSPAQIGKSGFKRRGKPIRGWNEADRNIPQEYEAWCSQWASALYPKVKDGGSIFIFGARRTIHRAIVALEDSGFLLRDILSWEKPNAHHRAQRLSNILEKRGQEEAARKWDGWRLGNLAPMWEPIAWLFKPYDHTITDNVLANEVGAIHIDASKVDGKSPSNVLKFWFEKDEERFHEAQKPISLLKFLIQLTTRENQIILDPFVGSGSTAVACAELNRHYIGIDISTDYVAIAEKRLASRQTASDDTIADVQLQQKRLL